MSMYNEFEAYTPVTEESLPRVEIRKTQLGKDAITLDSGVVLPKGISPSDLLDATSLAKEHVGVPFDLLVIVRHQLFSNGVEIGGTSNRSGDLEINTLYVSAARAKAMSAHREGFCAGPPNEQLWAFGFHQALNSARRVTGADFSNVQRDISDVLNGGILQKRFGPGVLYRDNTVVHTNSR